MALSVLIVDDHPSFRASARMLLEAAGYEVVGEARDGRSGLRAATELAPDVVLLDVHLPDVNGFEVATRLKADGSALAVIIVSSCDREDVRPLVQRCGARGFIAKAELSSDTLDTLLA
jgi:DNA-binding NarL/FixJ family response regulator